MGIIQRKLSKSFQAFFNSGKSSGILLIVCTIISLILANSVLGAGYLGFWQSYYGGLSVEHWINDALMAIFFLLIGLELERELYNGELSNFRNALLPIFAAIGETIQIAALATAFAVVLALPLGLAGAQTTVPRWLNLTTRMVLNAVRTLPSLIWALLAVAVVGANSLAGVVALTFYSLGYLGKFFSEALESVDTEIPDALRQAGADRVQAFQYGLLPEFKPLILSYALWMLEYNIRSAAIIGYVGAGGVGLLLHTYQEFGQWQKFCTVLIFILIVVTVLDFAGEWLRGKLTK